MSLCGAAYLFGRHRITCPTCDQETDFLTSFSGAWYGDILTCLSCGDAWSDGWRLERPFRRGWRQESIRYATERYATALSREDYLAATWAEVERYLDAEQPQPGGAS